jgi:tRNA-uridine 2-sulfurtransferase
MTISKRNVLVLMSGGVDSSVAAALLKEQGYSVNAVTMKIWAGKSTTGKGLHHGCYGPEEEADIEDARNVAEKIGINLKIIDLTREYQNIVLDYFTSEYLSGRTPNPCVRCNLRIKFGILIDKAVKEGMDFDFVASGHYAKVQYELNSSRYLLRKASDLSKDQSYFLSALSQVQLKRLMFPLGEYTKVEIRKIAEQRGLPVASKPDSQNFISGEYCEVMKTEDKPGSIRDNQGNILGIHSGVQHYTIGQRKGLGIAATEPVYVTAIDAAQNNIIIGERKDLYHQEFYATNLNWIAIPELSIPLTMNVKIRSSHKESEAEVTPIEAKTVRVTFKKPQFSITPGQAAVFYNGDVVIGGGIIEHINNCK